MGRTPSQGVQTPTEVKIGPVNSPVGKNVHVISRLARDERLTENFTGVLPFRASNLVLTLLLSFSPSVCLLVVRQFAN